MAKGKRADPIESPDNPSVFQERLREYAALYDEQKKKLVDSQEKLTAARQARNGTVKEEFEAALNPDLFENNAETFLADSKRRAKLYDKQCAAVDTAGERVKQARAALKETVTDAMTAAGSQYASSLDLGGEVEQEEEDDPPPA